MEVSPEIFEFIEVFEMWNSSYIVQGNYGKEGKLTEIPTK